MGIFDKKVKRSGQGEILPVPFREPRPLTASAVRIDIKDKTQVESLKLRRSSEKWQDEAWEYYDLVGELGYAARLISSVASRVRLYPAYVEDEENEPVHIASVKEIDEDLKKAASDALRLLETGNGGISGVIRDAAMNLFIAGECYLVQQPGNHFSGQEETWQIRSIDEVLAEGSKDSPIVIKTRRSARKQDYIKLPKSAFVGRIWRAHPRYSDEADSSVRSELELLDELLLLNKGARKTIKSRLNAGMLFIPDDIDNIHQSDGDLDDSVDTYAELSDDNSSTFEEEFINAAITPISDEGSASAVVPLIIRGPGDLADKIKHITFDQAFDEEQTAREDRVMNRILAGLDIPKEAVSGIADSKYANAVVIEESLFKAHVEPLVLLIVDALTVVFLRPVLAAMNYEKDEINKLVIWYDPSAITAKPSKADAATTGFNSKILSASAWRRENGFAESDAPTATEIGGRLAVDRGLLSEPVTEALLRILMPEIMEKVREESIKESPSGDTLDEVINNNQAGQDDSSPVEEPPVELIEP